MEVFISGSFGIFDSSRKINSNDIMEWVISIVKRENKTRVTLQQVADHAGVSRATVSLIIRGSKSISEATREKVLASMRQLGYVYDRNAANLRSKRSSNTVAVLITEIANPFFSELLEGIHHTLDQEGYTVILGTTFDSYEKQDNLLSNMLEYRVGGVILSPVTESSQETFERLTDWGIPVVLVTKEPPQSKYDYVGSDYVVGGEMAVEHLIQKGHKRIAFLGGPSESSAWKGRLQGYCNALKRAGLEFDETLLFESPVSREGGVNVIRKVLRHPNQPTAAFCFNDVVAFGVMIGLKEAGLTPGQDFAVVGYDDIHEAALFTPALTTIKSSPRLIGKIAADLLHQRIKGLDSEPQRILINPELVVRDST
jgi:LacI family transcriptional regulator